MEKENKRGQMAIWIIIAILMAAAIAILFFIRSHNITTNPREQSSPQAYIDKCVKDAVNEAVDKMLPQGGFIDPNDYKIYHNTKVAYLCQNTGYYKTCIFQHPMFITEESNEIKNYISPKVIDCFNSLKDDYESQRYSVSMTPMELNVSLTFDTVYVNINGELVLSKNDNQQKFKDFNTKVTSPIYDLSNVALVIAGEEAKRCYFEYDGYTILHSRWTINKFTFSESTKIYTIKDKYSGKELNIATRSCAIPPGI